MMFFSISGIDKNPLKHKCSTLNVNMILRFGMKGPKLNACHILQKRGKITAPFMIIFWLKNRHIYLSFAYACLV